MKKTFTEHPYLLVINVIWLIIDAALSTFTSVLLTFSTNAIFSKNMRQLFFWIAINLSVWLILLISDYFQTVFQEKFIQKIMVEIRATISSQITQKSYTDFHRTNTGEYLSEYINDAGNIEANSIRKIFSLISHGVLIIFATIALTIYHWLFLPVIIILSLLMMLLPSRLARPMSQATENLSDGNAKLSNHLTNYLNGFDVFFNFNRLPVYRKLVSKTALNYAQTKVDYTKTNARVTNTIGGLSIFCQVMVDIVTSILAITARIPLGAISSTGNIASTIFNSLSSFSNEFVQIKAIKPLFDKIEPASSSTDNVNEDITPIFNRSITIKNLNYTIDGKNIFNHLNLKLDKGGKYALIGKSGVGKSTLLKILSGQITDYTGEILIDNINLKKLSQTKLVNLLQYVDQNVYLFNDTVANNISLWDETLSLPNLKNSLNKAKIDFTTTNKQIIAENGQNLSGGQKQRLALARFFYQPKPIALIDEGLSALDEVTAAEIDNSLLADNDLTLLEVSHHLSDEMKAKYDKIISLDQKQS
ncbi:multidrug ABC superfamily ATP binding cassette transporter, ATPase and permease protein [Lapidilactobacillus concavus DSM 17758]|uniref:Multidrug ABC superfamily ATP binding cassette transporter, ATPase and permease protein n=1 Tax=Lapidilactobacillus concavus DSM 17758 TaxID=1423735 RepID=A0A0R1VRV0_9LACO|nr:ABC transporter ATP-binding protein [Lapidilactobacillus concavus]KRM08480.1 multidrug ABC superfamily ATP binding cassette transporter, ATPase and permease protein [Lapidilactobacillus concavus DSM 17758]GEL13850.1 multidrug ABC transporter permease [Lapidilactobacillus concavus]